MVLASIPSPINASAMEGKISSLPQKETHPLAAIHASQQSSTQEFHRRRRAGPPRPIILPMHRGCPAHILHAPNAIHTSLPWKESQLNPIASTGPPRHLILPILRASPARILRCSSTSHSTRHPLPDLAMLEYKIEDTSLSAQIWTPHLSETQTDLVYKIENYSCGCSSDNFRLVFLSFIYHFFSPIDRSFIIRAPFP
jgi:hypothetical protein